MTQQGSATDAARATLAEIHAANELAMQVWRQGEVICAEYLASRGFGLAAVTRAGFQVGYAPSSGAVCDALASHGFPLRVAVAAGLIRMNAAGGWMDVFRERLMFPVRNVHDGSIAGFTGRALPSAHRDAPRWLNSRTTTAFRKSELLFGLWEARQVIEQHHRRVAALVVCEGPLDAIAVRLTCPTSAVAPAGTALSTTQAQSIVDLASAARLPIVVACDGDAAGERAAAKAAALITSCAPNAKVSIASLPPGEDPASLAVSRATTLCEVVLPTGVSRAHQRLLLPSETGDPPGTRVNEPSTRRRRCVSGESRGTNARRLGVL